ncbi:MAG: hypothetical protein BGP07_09265 [Rhizobiales bacterium 63-22]|nr:MAG: hypothetical protein BGP07_09265 [Rhizobiales bacterium 63-22]
MGRVATVAVIVVAALLGYAMWNRYMEGPWTRDGTVRVYIATVTPEVSGNIAAIKVRDNQFVHKGDLLLTIDPTTYEIAVRQAEAALEQAKISVQSADSQIGIEQAQVAVNKAQLDQGQAGLEFARSQASRYETLRQTQTGSVQLAEQYQSQLRQQEASVQGAQATLLQAQRQVDALKVQKRAAQAAVMAAEAQLDLARTNLARTSLRSPVNGWVTNLRSQEGDFASAGKTAISVVDADSFWVDAYFEETSITEIRPGATAQIKLMGYPKVLKGHVASRARAIDVANAAANDEGVATVNPVFTWVRLAQRIPVRIQIDDAPKDLFLAAGMTASVQVDDDGPEPTHVNP